MTDIGVYTTAVQAEDHSWQLDPQPHNQGLRRNETLLVSLFTQAQHFVNGYIPSGTILGRVTASGLLGPYLDAASDGRQTAVGVLLDSVSVIGPAGVVKARVGVATLVAFKGITKARLPFTSGTAAGGGYIDANGQADLPLIFWAA